MKFKNPIAPKEEKYGKEPWSYKAPHYDQRSSRFVSAGCDYGVGFNQPSGRFGKPKMEVDVLPSGVKLEEV